MDNQKAICKKIKRSRLIKEITQDKIAAELNISIPTYSRFESGKTKMNINMLKKVCNALDLDFSTILISDEDATDSVSTVKKDSSKQELGELVDRVNHLVQLLEKQQKANQLLLEKFDKNLDVKSF